jgi:hypothetical protein
MNGQISLNEVAEKLFYSPIKRYTPHKLDELFRSRLIRPDKLAALLGVTEVAVRGWLRGSNPVPPKREKQLQDVWAKVLEWEKLHGRLFNSPAPVRHRVRK